jgi:hypothetical protein
MKKTIFIGLMFFTLSGHSQDTTKVKSDTISYEKNVVYNNCCGTRIITTRLVLKDTTFKNTYVPLTPKQKKRNNRVVFGMVGAFVSLIVLGSISSN